MRAAVLWAAIALAACGPAPAPPAPDPATTEAEREGARRYLAALAPLPEGWRPGRFAPEPGVSLETASIPARGARRGTVIFMPGYTAPLELYAAELGQLADAGWDVAALSQRGQGRSTRSGRTHDMGHVEDYAALVTDLRAFAATQLGPVTVVGVSMGGNVALRMAALDPPGVEAVAAIVPLVRIELGPIPPWAARALAEVTDRIGLGRRYAPGPGPWDEAGLFTDPAALAEPTLCSTVPERAHLRDALFTLDPSLRVDAPSYGWVAATFRSQDALARAAPAVDVPVLMVTAGADRIVSTPAASALCERIETCVELRLADAPHCLIEGDRTEARAVMRTVTDYLGAVVLR